MKIQAPTLVLCLAAVAGHAVADAPKKAPISRYTKLWLDSPFTTKPPPAGPAAIENPLEDYALIGVSSLGGDKYRATMLNKKKPDAPRIYLESGTESGGFKLIKVNRKNGNPLATTIQVQSGSATGTVSVDEKLLTLATPQPAKAAQNPQQNPNQPPGQDNNPNNQGRMPRPRVVPAPGGQAQEGVIPPQNTAQPNLPAVPAPQIQPNNAQGNRFQQGGNNQGQQRGGDRANRRRD